MPGIVQDKQDNRSSADAAEVDWAREIYKCLGMQFPGHDRRIDFLADKTIRKHIGEFEGQEIRVSGTTFADLKLAQEVIWQTKGLMPFGAGNLVADVFSTKGESYLRANFAQAKAARHHGLAVSSIKALSGNCSSHADVSFMLLSAQETDRPIARVSSTTRDHAFTMIGDYRDPKQEPVVVDAWPTFPSAFRFKDGNLATLSEKPLVKSWSAPGPKAPVEINLEELKPIPLSQIQDFFRGLGVPQRPGKELEEYIVAHNQKSDFLRNRLYTIKNPATTYMPAAGTAAVTTYEVPQSYGKARIKGVKKGAKRGFK